jgi:septum site-determining protein MinC
MAQRSRLETPGQEQPTPPRPPVAVKGGRDGLRIRVRSDADPEAAAASLKDQLSRRAGGFFLGASVVLELPGPGLDLALAERLAAVIAEGGMRLVAVEDAGALGESAPLRPAAPGAGAAPAAVGADGNAILVSGTLRSGQRLAHGGSVVVLGDVNPGAEVMAGGSVVVWGHLRGVVEAGLADGADDSAVCALNLAPTQLRIGGAIARAPEEPGRTPVPEIARVEDGRIVVVAWR